MILSSLVRDSDRFREVEIGVILLELLQKSGKEAPGVFLTLQVPALACMKNLSKCRRDLYLSDQNSALISWWLLIKSGYGSKHLFSSYLWAKEKVLLWSPSTLLVWSSLPNSTDVNVETRRCNMLSFPSFLFLLLYLQWPFLGYRETPDNIGRRMIRALVKYF